MRTGVQAAFAPIKSILPGFVVRPVRALGTAVIAPILFSSWSGHFKSSLRGKAVTPKGNPIPWYTYPCINFLERRGYKDRTVIEFGGGQSTLWWAGRVKKVITIEQDRAWYEHLKRNLPANVELHYVGPASDNVSPDLDQVKAIFDSVPGVVDIVVIDGAGQRSNLLAMSYAKLSSDGALICDDAGGYGFQEATEGWPIGRVDFYGYQPAVVLPNCTSIMFKPGCFLFDPKWPLVDIAKASFATAA